METWDNAAKNMLNTRMPACVRVCVVSPACPIQLLVTAVQSGDGLMCSAYHDMVGSRSRSTGETGGIGTGGILVHFPPEGGFLYGVCGNGAPPPAKKCFLIP